MDSQGKCNGVAEKNILTHKEGLPVCVLLVGIDDLTEIMPLNVTFSLVGSSCTYAGIHHTHTLVLATSGGLSEESDSLNPC